MLWKIKRWISEIHNPQGAYIPGEEIRHADQRLLDEAEVSAEGQPALGGSAGGRAKDNEGSCGRAQEGVKGNMTSALILKYG